jgi:hypothetical protein
VSRAGRTVYSGDICADVDGVAEECLEVVLFVLEVVRTNIVMLSVNVMIMAAIEVGC